MKREFHVRFCERLGVRFPGPTRLRFAMPTAEAKTGVPRNIQTTPLKPLVQALLTDLIAAGGSQSERMR
jgi:hypothetical protein